MTEKAFVFGEQQNLIGIFHEPDNDIKNPKLPTVLILNSGLVHRIGPYRMSVEIARELVKKGFSVFRFDLSGIGDSEKLANDKLEYTQRNISDVGEAIQFLKEKHGHQQFVTLGLCTGADLAHRSAMQYSQIIASILLDGYAYSTKQFYRNRYSPSYYLKRIKTALSDTNRLKLTIQNALSKIIPSKDDISFSGMDEFYWKLPEKSQYIDDMNQLHQRGNKHFYIFTAGVSYYNYAEQYADAFSNEAFLNDVTVSYYKESDHMFSLVEHRKAMINEITDWLLTQYNC